MPETKVIIPLQKKYYTGEQIHDVITTCVSDYGTVMAILKKLAEMPSTQLYGYNIEHLAYIARVMEAEGVTAEYAVRTFGDIQRAVGMVINELQISVEKAIEGAMGGR